MANNIENSFEPKNQDNDQECTESLKNHDRTVSTSQEMNQLITEYQNKGWKIDLQSNNHTKLTKKINSLMNPTTRMRGTIINLEVNITLIEQ